MVSIIIPVYNSENYIERCLTTIREQTYADFECICIDDGSTDRSPELIDSFILSDSRFCCLSQTNGGPAQARNRGLDTAKGEYVVFIDSDDTIERSYIEKLVNGVSKTMADVCCCGYTEYEKNNFNLQTDYPMNIKTTRESYLLRLFCGTGGTVCSKIFRTSIIRENNIRFHIQYAFCEDQLFALEYYCHCCSFTSILEYGYTYNRRDNSLSSICSYSKWYEQLTLLDNMENIMRESGVSSVVINRCCEDKAKDIIMHLIFCVCNKGYLSIKKVLNDDAVLKRLKSIHISNKSDMKWILPLKLKCYPIILSVYGFGQSI